MGRWGFLTNHALVLIHVANHPRTTLREISQAVGITERAALSILRAMEEDKIITREKEGRRNRYWVDLNALLDYKLPGPYSVQELAELLADIAKRLQKRNTA
jgi:DNA-binding Lrp family transcriptional regulator